jgi:hypothetical protein
MAKPEIAVAAKLKAGNLPASNISEMYGPACDNFCVKCHS